jgi:predicted dehydrogenase/nucleoside-diphosphate-sugar epimerase
MFKTNLNKNPSTRVALVGAGYISGIHAEALQLIPSVQLCAVVDRDLDTASSFAKRWKISNIFQTIDAAVAADVFDCAHILVPPDRHAEVALSALRGGKSVFLEKPMATTVSECDALIAASASSCQTLAINQNFIFHPAFVRLRAKIKSGAFGQPRAVSCVYSVPLRQMGASQFGHWMFKEPQNLLLEQAVHPLSQVIELVGKVIEVRALAGPPLQIHTQNDIYPEINVTLVGEKLPAQFRFAVGQSFPFWQLSVFCDDGVVVADISNNRVYSHGRTRWHPAIDGGLSATHTAAGIFCGGWMGCAEAVLAIMHPKARRDPFFRSMSSSIGAFYDALAGDASLRCTAGFGRELVALCQEIRSKALPAPKRTLMPPKISRTQWDVAVIGGTGFIGKHVVRRFLSEGLSVSVLGRSPHCAAGVLQDPRVVVHCGDARFERDVSRAVGDARVVINLAFSGGETWEAVRSATIECITALTNVCRRNQIERVIHVSSIAALYLGPRASKVTGGERPDPQQERRGIYARGKALGEELLLRRYSEEGLPVTILRPSVVVGEGGQLLHSGLGFFNNEQHIMGWNRGQNALPFVLVTDVAEAIWLATRAPKEVLGRCYNLVGDVRPCAREYIRIVADTQGRAFRFHPQSPTKLWVGELSKGLVKRLKSRAATGASLRDILSRGMTAEFDNNDAKHDLGWQPVADRDVFYSAAVPLHTR